MGCFFFNDTATTEIYTLSLHDALPISAREDHVRVAQGDLLSRGDYGLQPRAAHPVEGHTRHLDRQPALYADLTTRVHALARREDVADDDLIHLLALDARAGKDLLADRGPEIRRRGVLERPAEGADTRPEGRRNDYLEIGRAHV